MTARLSREQKKVILSKFSVNWNSWTSDKSITFCRWIIYSWKTRFTALIDRLFLNRTFPLTYWGIIIMNYCVSFLFSRHFSFFASYYLSRLIINLRSFAVKQRAREINYVCLRTKLPTRPWKILSEHGKNPNNDNWKHHYTLGGRNWVVAASLNRK